MAERSLQELLITNFSLGPSGYTGSRGDAGYVGSGGGSSAPTIATIGYIGDNTATDVAGGETVTLTGTGFVTGCSIIINGSPVGAVTFISATQVTFTAPALSAGTYILYLVNSNGATAISVPGISYSGVPSFYTGAGSVGTVYEASSFNSNVAAVGDSAIIYSIASGLLPTGATLNANGVITGTSVLTGNATTYTFGVTASDGQNQDVTRTYTITVNPDSVTWSSPASGATVSLGQNSSSTTTLTATSAAGKAITYTANALPTGLSIVGSAVTGTPTVLGNTTSVLTANATSTTRSADITVTWNIAVLSDPYFAYNSLLLSGNGANNATNNTFVDSSTNNFAVTRYGNTTQGTFSPYGANWSNYFDGSSGSVSIPYNANYVFGTNDFTVECWVMFNDVSATGRGLVALGYGANGTGPVTSTWALRHFGSEGSNQLAFYRYNGSTETFYTTSGFSPSNGVWYHIAVSRTGGNLRIFVNGVALFSGANSFNYTAINTSDPFLIGLGYYGPQFNMTGPRYFNGYISNLRVINGTGIYSSSFTPPTAPLTAVTNTTLLTCQSNRYVDNSPIGVTLSPSGTTSIQRFSPFSPSAAYSASTVGGSATGVASGDYLTGGGGSAAALQSNNFTIEFWIYLTNASANAIQAFYSNYTTFGTGTGALYLGKHSNNSGYVALWVSNASASVALLAETSLPPGNAWTHYALVRNGSTFTLYRNGISTASATFAGSVTPSTIPANYIMAAGDSATSYPPPGLMANFRLVNGTAVYTSNFTPPTAPLTAITNTALLLNFTNAGIIDNTMQNNLQTVGDAKISTAQSKFGGSSMAFDGTGDYLVANASPFWIMSGDWTIEAWIYPENVTGVHVLIDTRNRTTNPSPVLYTNGTSLVIDTGSGVVVSAGTITINTWQHIAATRSGNSWRIFINGTQVGSTGTNSTTYSTAYGCCIGSSYYNETYVGYIDDLRVTRGLARYTANFTPPSSALVTK